MNDSLKKWMAVICSGTLMLMSPGIGVYEALAAVGVIKIVPTTLNPGAGAAGVAGRGAVRLNQTMGGASFNLKPFSLPSAHSLTSVPGAASGAVSKRAKLAPASARTLSPSAASGAVKGAVAATPESAGRKESKSTLGRLKDTTAKHADSPKGSQGVAASLNTTFDGSRLNAAGTLGAEDGYTPGGSNDAWTATPVEVQPSQDNLDGLSETQKEDAAEAASLMERRLFKWTKTDYTPPRSIFSDADGQLISVGDLFRRPTGDDEVERIGAERRKFSSDQMAQIKEDASFKVVSEEFEGQQHEWQLGGLVQRGSTHIRDTRQNELAMAYDNAAIQIPKRVIGPGTLSLRKTIPDFFGGLWDTAGLFYGRIRTRGLSEYEIEGIISSERRSHVEVLARGAGADMTLFDAELMEKAGEVLYSFEDRAYDAWEQNRESTQKRIEAELAQEGLDGAEYRQALADRMASAQNEELFKLIRGSDELEALKSGLGRMLVDHGKAIEIVRSEEAKFDRNLLIQMDRYESELKAAHPIKSRIRSWMSSRLDAFRSRGEVNRSAKIYGTAISAAREAGLDNEALILTAEAEFYNRITPELRKKLAAEKKALHRFSFDRIIWNAKNWKIKQYEDGEYYAETETTYQSDSSRPAWRIEKALVRTFNWISNAAYFLLKENLVNGRLGLRSLFSVKPFQYRRDVNAKTGAIEPYGGPRQTLVSRIGNLWASRREILRDHENKNNYGLFGKAFERFLLFFTADLGRGVIAPLIVLIGQPILTAANVLLSAGVTVASMAGVIDIIMIASGMTPFFTPYLGAGLLWIAGTPYLGTGLMWIAGLVGLTPAVLATIGAPAFTLVGMAAIAAIAWAPAASLFLLLFNALIYDSTGVSGGRKWYGHFFPWAKALGLRTFWSGTVLTAVTAAALAVFHPLMALGLTLLAGIQSVVRTMYDAVLRGVIKTLGRVPGRDARFLVRRVAGPGLSSQFYFQVAPELALVAFWAGMESGEHGRYTAATSEKIYEPKNTYGAFLEALSAVTGRGSIRANDEAPGIAEILASQKGLIEGLADAAKPNDELYAKLLDIDNRGRIKMTLENYKETLAKASVLAKQFHTKVFAAQGWDKGEIAGFWKQRNLKANDWVSLAKLQFSETFGAGFLIPLEESDTTLKIDVEAPSLGDYAKGLEDGILPEDLKDINLGRIGKGSSDVDDGAETTVPRISPGDLLSTRHR